MDIVTGILLRQVDRIRSEIHASLFSSHSCYKNDGSVRHQFRPVYLFRQEHRFDTKANFGLPAALRRRTHPGGRSRVNPHPDRLAERNCPGFRIRTSRRSAGNLCRFRHESVRYAHVCCKQNSHSRHLHARRHCDIVGPHCLRKLYSGGEIILTSGLSQKSFRQTAIDRNQVPRSTPRLRSGKEEDSFCTIRGLNRLVR
jgi:hypothetical protein